MPGLGILKDRLYIIEQLIVSKLVSHLLCEYTCGLQALAESVFFPSSSHPQLKPTEVWHSIYRRTRHLAPNICESPMERRDYCSSM